MLKHCKVEICYSRSNIYVSLHTLFMMHGYKEGQDAGQNQRGAFTVWTDQTDYKQ